MFVLNQAFAKTRYRILDIAEFFIKRQSRIIASPDLQIKFGAALLRKPLFGRRHHLATITPMTVGWRNREIINPAAVPIKASHRTCAQFALRKAKQKRLSLHRQFAIYIQPRIIPWPDEFALYPQLDNRFAVFATKRLYKQIF